MGIVKRSLNAASASLLLLGIGVLVVSLRILEMSNGVQIGGIYFAVTSMVAGLSGLQIQSTMSANMLTFLCFINVIVSLVGLTINSNSWDHLQYSQACVQYIPNALNSTSYGLLQAPCTTETGQSYYNFTCTGSSLYFDQAISCGESLVRSDGTISAKQCGCVASNTARCYSYSGFDDCDVILTDYEYHVFVVYIFGIICTLVSIALMVSSCVAARFRQFFMRKPTDEDRGLLPFFSHNVVRPSEGHVVLPATVEIRGRPPIVEVRPVQGNSDDVMMIDATAVDCHSPHTPARGRTESASSTNSAHSSDGEGAGGGNRSRSRSGDGRRRHHHRHRSRRRKEDHQGEPEYTNGGGASTSASSSVHPSPSPSTRALAPLDHPTELSDGSDGEP